MREERSNSRPASVNYRYSRGSALSIEDELAQADENFSMDDNDEPKLSFWERCNDWFHVDIDQMKQTIVYILDSAKISITMDDILLCMAAFVLFGQDIQLTTLGDGADYGFEIALSICMFTFVVEFLLSTWSKSHFSMKFTSSHRIFPKFEYSGYLFSPTWFFDILFIFSMWPDISWIANGLQLGFLSSTGMGYFNYKNGERVMRLTKMIRLLRYYRTILTQRREEQREREIQQMVHSGDIDIQEAMKIRQLHSTRHSKLGSQLSSVILRHVVVIILVMVIILPLLYYNPTNTAPEYAISFLHQVNMDPTLSIIAKQAIVNGTIASFQQGPLTSPMSYLIALQVSPLYDDYILYDTNAINRLRESSMIKLLLTTNNATTNITYTTYGIFDSSQILQLSSQYRIYLMLCIGFLLVSGYLIFTADVQRLVLTPIERMMNMVEIIAQDPLQPIDFSDIRFQRLQGKYATIDLDLGGRYEMKILTLSLQKVTGLLRVGFGEAGARIISANLDIDQSKSLSGNSGSVINALIPGIRVYAIFGFCDIHHFEEINQSLGTGVLKFVNYIADIVHSSTHTWGGQCNKNLGNAFVIVWRIGDEDTLRSILEATSNTIRGNVISPVSHVQHPFAAAAAAAALKLQSERQFLPRPSIASMELHHTNSSNDGDSSSPTNGGGRVRFGDLSTDAMEGGISSRSSKGDRGSNRNHSSSILKKQHSYFANPKAQLEHILLPAGMKKKQKKTQTIDLRKIPGVEVLADSALVAYLKVIVEINRSKSILKYRNDSNILRLLQRDEFKVRMGFGLHAGWAIEGAVGSELKVDATYLSPHVNMAARLETASKQYNVPLLMSDVFHSLLSEVSQSKIRQLDVITVKGSEVPLGIYTYDCYQEQCFMKRTRDDYLLYNGRPRVSRRHTRGSFTEDGQIVAATRPSIIQMDDTRASFTSVLNGEMMMPSEEGGSDREGKTAYEIDILPNDESLPTVTSTRPRFNSFAAVMDNILHPFKPPTNGDGGDQTTGEDHMATARKRSLTMDMFSSSVSSVLTRNKRPTGKYTAIHRRESLNQVELPQLATQRRASYAVTMVPSFGQEASTANPEELGVAEVDPEPSEMVESIVKDEHVEYDSVYRTLEEMDAADMERSSPIPHLPVDTSPKTARVLNNKIPSFRNDTTVVNPNHISVAISLFPSAQQQEEEPAIDEATMKDDTALDISGAARISLKLPVEHRSSVDSDQSLTHETLNRTYPAVGGEDDLNNHSRSFAVIFMTPTDDINDIMELDVDLVMLRAHITEDFTKVYAAGLKYYIQGDWMKAKIKFELSNEMMKRILPQQGGDGPSQTLLKYMESFNYSAPRSWKGFRPLTSK